VTWDEPQEEESIIEVYWLVAWVQGEQAAILSVVPHPEDGAIFWDGSDPPVVDPMVGLGNFGFSMPMETKCPVRFRPWPPPGGAAPSPTPGETAASPAAGACCLEETCIPMDEPRCAGEGGVYHGDGIECEPETCDLLPTLERSWGQVKEHFREALPPRARR
jgi:hypothetical protein